MMTTRRCALAVLATVAAAGCSGGSDAVPAPGLQEVTSTAQPDTTAVVTEVATSTTVAPATTTAASTTTSSAAPTTVAESTTLPAPSTTEAPAGPFYRAGDEGPEVAIIQLKLATAGFLGPGYTDGVFDSATNSAVLDFQGQYGLIVDGIVGPETERALTAAALSVNPEPG